MSTEVNCNTKNYKSIFPYNSDLINFIRSYSSKTFLGNSTNHYDGKLEAFQKNLENVLGRKSTDDADKNKLIRIRRSTHILHSPDKKLKRRPKEFKNKFKRTHSYSDKNSSKNSRSRSRSFEKEDSNYKRVFYKKRKWSRSNSSEKETMSRGGYEGYKKNAMFKSFSYQQDYRPKYNNYQKNYYRDRYHPQNKSRTNSQEKQIKKKPRTKSGSSSQNSKQSDKKKMYKSKSYINDSGRYGNNDVRRNFTMPTINEVQNNPNQFPPEFKNHKFANILYKNVSVLTNFAQNDKDPRLENQEFVKIQNKFDEISKEAEQKNNAAKQKQNYTVISSNQNTSEENKEKNLNKKRSNMDQNVEVIDCNKNDEDKNSQQVLNELSDKNQIDGK